MQVIERQIVECFFVSFPRCLITPLLVLRYAGQDGHPHKAWRVAEVSQQRLHLAQRLQRFIETTEVDEDDGTGKVDDRVVVPEGIGRGERSMCGVVRAKRRV